MENQTKTNFPTVDQLAHKGALDFIGAKPTLQWSEEEDYFNPRSKEYHAFKAGYNKRDLDAREFPKSAERYDARKFTPPFRVGKSQGRAVLDATGSTVLLFESGRERQAELYCDYLNNDPFQEEDTSEMKFYVIILETGKKGFASPWSQEELETFLEHKTDLDNKPLNLNLRSMKIKELGESITIKDQEENLIVIRITRTQ